MNEALPVDPYRGEFFRAFFMRRLWPLALRWCGQNKEDALDLVHDTAKWFYDWKPWEKGLPYEDWFPYSVTVMKRIHYRRVNDESRTDQLDGEMEERIGSDDSKAAKNAQYKAERRSLGSKLIPLCEGNKKLEKFVYYRYLCDMTRAEIAEAMGLSPREVTDLERQFLYRVTPEKAIKYLGLVPKEERA